MWKRKFFYLFFSSGSDSSNKTADNLLYTDRQKDIQTDTNIQNRYKEIERESESKEKGRGPEADFWASCLQTSYRLLLEEWQ